MIQRQTKTKYKMKTTLKPLAMAVLVAVFTVVSFISLKANDDTKSIKQYQAIYTQPDDTNHEDTSGGPVIPPQPLK